ncbi:MAG: serine hydrolase domain-containing protein [Gaiellales bacterium]
MDGQSPLTIENWLWDMHGTRSLQRLDEFRPLERIGRGSGPVRDLPAAPVDLGGVELVDRAGATVTLEQHLETSFTEGLLVLKHGAVAFERYRNGLRPDTRHLLASVTKSVTATVLGIAVGRGALRLGDRVADVAPEFAGTSVEDATIQQMIDMTVGTGFDETHDTIADPEQESQLVRFFRQTGTMPLGDAEPLGVLGLFRTLPQAYPHGERFEYRTPLTCVVARILEVATGRPYIELVSEDVWAPLGMEHDAAIVIDVGGFPFAGGGMTATLRDVARYGQAHLDGGVVDGRQVIPADWIAATRDGSDDTRRAFAACPQLTDEDRAAWSEYRNAFWVAQPGRTYEALGLFGQVCRINEATGTVIARFSAQPMLERTEIGFEAQRAHAAIEAALAG